MTTWIEEAEKRRPKEKSSKQRAGTTTEENMGRFQSNQKEERCT
jgi:hypothetical protein